MENREPHSLSRQETPPDQEEAPRYATLSDYARVVRRRWWIIAAVGVLFAAVAFLYFSIRSPEYEARARIAINGVPTDSAPHLGLFLPSSPTAQGLKWGELARSPEVARRAKRILKTDLSPEELQDDVELQPAGQPGVGLIAGRSSDRDFAADLSNAYARALRAASAADLNERLNRAQQVIADEVKEIQEDPLQLPAGVDAPDPRIQPLDRESAALRTIGRFTKPVEISERAEVPEAPTALVPAVYTLVAGLIGLILGTLGAFGRESLDRRLHSAEEVQEELRMPVLARVSEAVLGRAGLASNGYPAVPGLEFEPFRALRLNLGYLLPADELRSILVTSGRPEEGKSTVSMSLASAAVLAGKRTLLVECDFHRPCFAQRLGVADRPGLTDYLLGTAGPQEVLQTVQLREPVRSNGAAAEDGAEIEGAPSEPAAPAGTLVCISAGSETSNPAELLISDRCRDFLEKVTRAYDLVVFDSSPLLNVVDSLELVTYVDAVILCVRARQTTRDDVRASRAALAKVTERPTGAVLTGVLRHGPDSEDYYAS